MSLAGIRSNRGDGYQTLVAFGWALSVLTDGNYLWLEVDSTTLDASGKPIAVDDVVVGRADGSLVCCQCKKNQTHFKDWTIADLADELAKASQLLAAEPSAQVIFYTRGNFGVLAKLREHSQTQPNEAAYQASLSKEHRKTDADLAKAISGISTYEWLKRTVFEVSPELERMEELLMERLAFLASNAQSAYNALWTKLDNLGGRVGNSTLTAPNTHRLSKADLCTIIEYAGATIIPPRSLQELQQSFANTSAIGRSWRRDIAGNTLEFSIVNDLIQAVEAKQRSVLLAGIPGSGKTCVLLALQEKLEQCQNLTSLFIQAREFANCVTSQDRVAQGLPDDLVNQVGRMADFQATVVVIDSLDVLSVSREHQALSFFLAQIDRLLLIPNVTVIAACRDFDRKYDRRLAERKWDATFIIPPLDWDTAIAPLLDKHGIEPNAIDAITRSLIKNPRELALFMDIALRTGSFNVVNSQALSRKYLATIIQDDSTLGNEAMTALEKMASQMVRERRLDLTRSQIRVSDDKLKCLFSAEVLHQNDKGNIEFGHQTLLDVLVVSGAERENLSLKNLIENLPAVPFVRPTIRVYVGYLASGERKNFRKQIRAVFDSKVAFHIKRLVAETFAEQTPQDNDWPLIRDLHQQHRGLFNALYYHADALAWHHFWLKFFVPYVQQLQDTDSFMRHVNRIGFWKTDDPKTVLSFWEQAMQQPWLDRNQLGETLMFTLDDFPVSIENSTAPLIETLLSLPRRQHDFLGKAVARCVTAGATDDNLLWRYITRDLQDEDLRHYELNGKLQCGSHKFGEGNFFQERMLKSEALLDLAINSIEQWSWKQNDGYWQNYGFHEGFLNQTSWGDSHSRHQYRHVSAISELFRALEAAILQHARGHSLWWQKNCQRLSQSYEGVFRYLAMLAFTEEPVPNIEAVTCLVLDKQMLESESLRYEMGSLLHSAFCHLDASTQDHVLLSILTLFEDKDVEHSQWIFRERAELLSAIPVHLRSTEAQVTLNSWEQKNGDCIRQPDIYSSGGIVSAPFSYQRFLDYSDKGVLKILSHYDMGSRDDWEPGSMIGGAEQVGRQLHEAATRDPLRFIRLLAEHWTEIPERFTDEILDGVAMYLAYRYGNLGKQNWQPVVEADPQLLATLILDEIERHPVRWHHCRAVAKSLQACAKVVKNHQDASRLLFAAIGFLNFPEKDTINDSRDLINVGINMTRGHVAEAVIIVATQFAESNEEFPELLIPNLRRFANDPHPAVRAVLLHRLPYLQSLSPELGWDIFALTMQAEHEGLWQLAGHCLYYTYHKEFAKVSPILDRFVASTDATALEVWGRLSALAVLSGLLNADSFIAQLQTLQSIDAWQGAAAVWSNDSNIINHREECFFGLNAGLQETNAIAFAVAQKAASIFDKKEPIILVPDNIITLFFAAYQYRPNDERLNLWRFDAWLNALSQHAPDEALTTAERFIEFVEQTQYHLYQGEDITQLLTRLFGEAEEKEEADEGLMLNRVINLQDKILALGVHGLENWLRDAERP